MHSTYSPIDAIDPPASVTAAKTRPSTSESA
jgi:hypothetical protein